MAPTLSIEDVATRLCVDRDTVGYWIANKELVAINVSKKKNAIRPSWRISEESLAAFELMRQTIAPPPKSIRKRDNYQPSRKWFAD